MSCTDRGSDDIQDFLEMAFHVPWGTSALRGSSGHQAGSCALGLGHHWCYYKSMRRFCFSLVVTQYFNWLVELWMFQVFTGSRSASSDWWCNVSLDLNLFVLNLYLFRRSFCTQELVSDCSACIMVPGLVIFLQVDQLVFEFHQVEKKSPHSCQGRRLWAKHHFSYYKELGSILQMTNTFLFFLKWEYCTHVEAWR